MRLKISILGLGLLLNVSFMVNLAKCYITLSLWGDILILPRGGSLKMRWPVLPPQIFFQSKARKWNADKIYTE